MSKKENGEQIEYADPRRFDSGEFDYRLDKPVIRKPGDISDSYCADKIAMERTIRKPFQWKDGLRISTGGIYMGKGIDNVSTWRIIPEEYYKGEVFDYPGKPNSSTYEGMRVKWKGQAYVLSNRLILKPREEKNIEQLNLF